MVLKPGVSHHCGVYYLTCFQATVGKPSMLLRLVCSVEAEVMTSEMSALSINVVQVGPHVRVHPACRLPRKKRCRRPGCRPLTLPYPIMEMDGTGHGIHRPGGYGDRRSADCCRSSTSSAPMASETSVRSSHVCGRRNHCDSVRFSRLCLCVECDGRSEKRRTAEKVIDLRTSSAAGQLESTLAWRWGRGGGYSAHGHGIVRYPVHWGEETTGCTSHRTGEASQVPARPLLTLNGPRREGSECDSDGFSHTRRVQLESHASAPTEPPSSGYCRLHIFTYVWIARGPWWGIAIMRVLLAKCHAVGRDRCIWESARDTARSPCESKDDSRSRNGFGTPESLPDVHADPLEMPDPDPDQERGTEYRPWLLHVWRTGRWVMLVQLGRHQEPSLSEISVPSAEQRLVHRRGSHMTMSRLSCSCELQVGPKVGMLRC